MATLMTDGMDQYTVLADLSIRYTTSAATGYDATGGRTGGGAITLNNDDLPCFAIFDNGLSFNALNDHVHTAFWFRTTALPSATDTIVRYSADGIFFGNIRLTPAGEIIITQWNGLGSAGTSPAVILAGEWHHIELDCRWANGAGSLARLYVDGDPTPAIDVADLDMFQSGTVIGVNKIYLEGHTNGTVTFDDLFVWNEDGTDFALTTQLGEHIIETIVPDGDAAVQFTPTGAGTTNSDRVDETGIDDGDTTYVESSTIGHEDRYTMAAQTFTPSKTHVLAVMSRAKKTDVGAVNMRNIIRHGSTTGEAGDHLLASSYGTFASYYGKNPDTSADWGTTDVDAAEAGVKYES